MKRKKFTRKTPWLFTNLRKQPCPTGHFKTENDLFEAFVDWLDFYDPIGFVRNWGVRREHENEADYLVMCVQHCQDEKAFADLLHRCFCEGFFDIANVKPHFLRRGFPAIAQDGWALWRRFEFDTRQNPTWVAARKKLAQFRPLDFAVDDGVVRTHRLLNAGGIDCLFQRKLGKQPLLFLEFIASDLAGLTDAQIIEKAWASGVLAEGAQTQVLRDQPGFVTVTFDHCVVLRPDGAYTSGPSPRRRKRVSVIDVD